MTARRAAALLGLACALPAAVAAGETALEVIEVTGTRIARPDFESPSPVVTVPEAVITSTGAVTLERSLEQYPQFVAAAGATSNDPGNDGQANVSLRGLGANRTLVLLDGRRLIPADGNGAVDLNILPPALVESVEVMTGGASAAYGSDAIAGVVNVRLRKRFEGVALEGSGATTDHGDGTTSTAGLTAGTEFADGRGTLMGYVGYAQRDAVLQGDRAFSRYPLEYFAGSTGGHGPGGAFLASGSGSTEEGVHIVFASPTAFNSVFSRYGFTPGSVSPQQGFGVNADGTLFTIGTGAPGSVLNYRGERDPVMFNDRTYTPYNFASVTALQLPLERRSAFVRGTFAANDAVEWYAQALYADYSVERRLSSAQAGIALVPITNPFMPADLAELLAGRTGDLAARTAPYRYFRLLPEVGTLNARNERDVLQVTAGVRGQFASDWSYDVYVQHGANDRDEYQTNNISLTRFQELTFAADGGQSICAGGLNPFNATPLSSECIDYVAFDATNAVTLRQSLAEASVSGSIGALPAGEVSLAAGVLYKHEDFDFDADPAISAMLPSVPPDVIGPRPDVSGFPGVPDRSGDVSNTDLYAELHVPLLRGLPGVDALELGLGYRYSDYSQAGSANSYKAELQYRPVAPLRVRGSFQHAVRAPGIEELYFPPVANQFEIPRPDPCDADKSAIRNGPLRAQVEALCLAQGISPAQLPTFNYELRRTNGVAGGNPDLQPEQADTTTVGLVFTHATDGGRAGELQVSLDWYRIEIDDGIGRWDAKSAVERCFDPQYNPTFDPGNVYCSFFTRDATTGFIFANIVDRNIGGLQTAGVDLQLDWSFGFGSGVFGVNGLVSYVDTWQYLDPSGGTIEYAGTVGGGGLGRSLPQWKSLLNLTFSANDGWNLLARWRHVGSASDVVYRDFDVPAANYIDLGGSYAFTEGTLDGLTIRGGIDNAFDEQPPILPTWQQANTDPSQYDVLGRSFYLKLQYALR
jgi:outer membrane receptor protein involved in Fe transport